VTLIKSVTQGNDGTDTAVTERARTPLGEVRAVVADTVTGPVAPAGIHAGREALTSEGGCPR
jgi:hypothetical protein